MLAEAFPRSTFVGVDPVPHSVSEGGAALGAQAGPAKLTAAFREAGFTSARVAAATTTNLIIEAAG